MFTTLLSAAPFEVTAQNVIFKMVLPLVAGIALFLFGMNVMGESLEKSAGNKLKGILGKMTQNPIKGFLLGAGVTAVIQSSSATTVMLVGFVNSGLITLGGAIPIIMGANVGTTITAWILSLTGIEGESLFLTLLKPSSFTPVLAAIGAVLYLFIKSEKKKNVGLILLGFSVLIFGMDMMSEAVAPLKTIPEFGELLLVFNNPILGVLMGAGVTAIIQSSSASVGILQALTVTGAVTFGTAIPVIMGQNIGTCITALISSIGANKDAKRVAMVHLYFNIIGTVVLLLGFYILHAIIGFDFITNNTPIDKAWIAIIHTMFNLLATSLLLPFGKQLAKLATLTVRDTKKEEEKPLFDDRLLATPAIAIEHARQVTVTMAERTLASVKKSFDILNGYTKEKFREIEREEGEIDVFEDEIGSYLLKITSHDLSETDSFEVTKLLHTIGDLERLSDHSVNIAESADEMFNKDISFSEEAKQELKVMIDAVGEILDKAINSFKQNDSDTAASVEPLEEVIDGLRSEIKLRHIQRLKNNECTVELGFILTDLLTNLERVADHCSNIAGCVIEISRNSLGLHSYTESVKRGNTQFERDYAAYAEKYQLS